MVSDSKNIRRGIKRVGANVVKPPLDPVPEYEPKKLGGELGRPPLDPVPEYEPKKLGDDWLQRFEILIDPELALDSAAMTRIEKSARQAVLMEIADLDSLPEFRVATKSGRGTRRFQVMLIRD